MADIANVSNIVACDGFTSEEKPHHYTYLKDFRTKQCPDFLQHKCTQHRPFTCFNWHFANQKRRRPVRRKDGTFNYSADVYCTKYDETTGVCPDGDECPLLHRTAGDTERRYHIRYYKTCPCVYETDSKGNCSRNGPHCAFAHGLCDLRKPVYDIRELEASQTNPGPSAVVDSPLGASLESDRLLNEDPVWNDPKYVLTHYKTELCRRPLRLCRQGYACPSYHNPRDKRRSPAGFKYRSTPCPNVKQGDEWGDPSKCENGDNCGYCHTRTEQQFHLEIYKSTKCNDMVQTGYCPRGLFCAFAHVEQEMNMQWDVSGPSSTPLAAFVDDALAPLMANGKKDDHGPTTEGKHLAPGEERARRNTMPSIQSSSELFIRTSEASGQLVNGGRAMAEMSSPHMVPWGMHEHANSRVGDTLSSSLNDSFLASYALHSSGLDTPQSRVMRPGSMSIGSYQQYQQYREQLRQSTASGGDGTRLSMLPQMQGGDGSGMGLPPSFFTATPQSAFPLDGAAPHGGQLPPSFYGSQDSSMTGGGREDDLDLNLDDLKLENLDEQQDDRVMGNILGGPGFSPSAAAAFANPALLPDNSSGMNVTNRLHQGDVMGLPPMTNGCASMSGRPPMNKPGFPSKQAFQFHQLQQQQQEIAALFAHAGPPPPPGLVQAHGNLPAQSPSIAPGTVSDEILHLHQELLAKKQAIMRWEEGMKQAYNACEAWKSEAEKQERRLRQVEEERNKACQKRDNIIGRLQTLMQVAEMKHELEMLNTAPMLHALQRDVDYQQVPLATVQQIHAIIRHDFELVEQMIRNLGLCLVCKEHHATVTVIPCTHMVLCYTCAANATECPQCNAPISSLSPVQPSPPVM